MAGTDAHMFESRLPEDADATVRRLVEYNRDRCRALLEAAGHAPVRSIGIVGAGLMGTAVAAASLAAGLDVVLADADPIVLDRAAEGVLAALERCVCSRSRPAARRLGDRLCRGAVSAGVPGLPAVPHGG